MNYKIKLELVNSNNPLDICHLCPNSSPNRHSDVSGKKNKNLYVTMSICRQNN